MSINQIRSNTGGEFAMLKHKRSHYPKHKLGDGTPLAGQSIEQIELLKITDGLSEAQVHNAKINVCAYARDVVEAKFFLGQLGLA